MMEINTGGTMGPTLTSSGFDIGLNGRMRDPGYTPKPDYGSWLIA